MEKLVTVEIDLDALEDMGPEEFKQAISDMLDGVPETARFRYESGDFDCAAWCEFFYYREETKEEAQKRAAYEADLRAWADEEERKTYERLKEKYGG